MEAMERLGSQLRSRRLSLGLSQAEVADRIGISRSQLSHVETGKSVTLRTLFDVAFDLGLDIIATPRGSRAANEARAALAEDPETASEGEAP